MKRLLCLAALIVLTMPAFAQSRTPRSLDFASDFQTVPVMANTTGNGGATFQSYVALLNPTSSAYSVNVDLYDAAGTKHSQQIQLAAGELKTWTNFLGTVFNYTGGGAATFRTTSGSNRFVLNTEIWTSAGHYGTSVPALEFAGTDSPSFSPGITVGANSRTNIGCFNQSGSANTIKAIVRDATGSLSLGTVTLNLPANAWGQRALTTVVSGGYVQFEPSDAAVCYAVVVDNITNDGRFIPAAEYRP